ncbi:MAG: VOC family protein [Acidimicrobiia bacterium]
MSVTSVAAVRIAVHDLDAARSFYCNDLGLSERSSDPGWMVLDAGIDVIVERVEPGEVDDDEIAVGRFTGVSFRVDDIDGVCATLVERGAHMVGMPQRQPWGGVLAHVADPDGNVVTLVQYPRP